MNSRLSSGAVRLFCAQLTLILGPAGCGLSSSVMEGKALEGVPSRGARTATAGIDLDGDGAGAAVDCDDTDPDIYPGAEELPDGLDNDCSGLVDDREVCFSGAAPSPGELQAAVNAAPDGFTLLVCAGTWRENLDLSGRDLHLLGVSGASDTIIDGGGVGPALIMRSPGESKVTGFTLENGWHKKDGGGVRCKDASLSLEEVVIAGNSSVIGGGLSANACQLKLIESEVRDNSSSELGGGAALYGCSGKIQDSLFEDNTAGTEGGGLAVYGGGITVRSSTFRGNVAEATNTGDHGSGPGGGGLWIYADITVEDNLIEDNTSYYNGGGVYVLNGYTVLDGNTIQDNLSHEDGGGVYLNSSYATVSGNLLQGNEAQDDGGGLRVYVSAATVEDNEFRENVAADDGGGVKFSHYVSTFRGNLVVDNVAGDGGGGMELDNDASLVEDCVFSGNSGAQGGGVRSKIAWTSFTIQRSDFLNNTSSLEGGGLHLAEPDGTINLYQLKFEGNEAPLGGGLYTLDSSVNLSNAIFADNVAEAGGGLWMDASTGTLSNLTVVLNEAPVGSGLYLSDSEGVTVQNAIVASNASGVGVSAEGNAPGAWTYSDVWGNEGGAFEGMSDPTGEDGNLAMDPGFEDAGMGDFRLGSGSVCVDAGSPAVLDVDGTRSDMGAFGGPLGL